MFHIIYVLAEYLKVSTFFWDTRYKNLSLLLHQCDRGITHTYENSPKMFHIFYLAEYSKVSTFLDTWYKNLSLLLLRQCDRGTIL